MINAAGEPNSKIRFDGQGILFNPAGSNASTFVNLDYCIIKNVRLWEGYGSGSPGNGYFKLTHSELYNLGWSYIWYPGNDVYIEFNSFFNTGDSTGGLSIGSPSNVYIMHNLFAGKNADAEYLIENWANYNNHNTIVHYNSFINIDGHALYLPPGYNPTGMNATQNYWGTTNTNSITSMIYDNNTDITCASSIPYLPILTAPNLNTPVFVNASSNAGGFISPNGAFSVNYGDSQTFTISANSGYHISIF